MSRLRLFTRALVMLLSIVLCIVPTIAVVISGSIPAKAAPLQENPESVQADAGKIVFASERDGNREIYVMDADGGNPINLTQNAALDDHPVWSPDGSKIAFASLRDLDWEVYVMNADGSNQTRITYSPGTDFLPVWSPDGSHIAFTSARDIDLEVYVMGADGSNPVNISNDPGYDEQPAWSPDGSKILFASTRDGDYELYTVDPDGGNLVQLTKNANVDYRGDWSPDGSKIAFNTERDGNYELYIMNADGSDQHNISNNPANDFRPAWSPDGSKIAFFANREGNDEIYTINADGSNITRLTNNGVAEGNPDWTGPASPSGPSNPGGPTLGQLFRPVVHAVIPTDAKATLNSNTTHGYAGQAVTLSGLLSAGAKQVQIATTFNGQTHLDQIVPATGGAYSTDFIIPATVSTGKLQVCAAAAGIVNAEYSCMDLNVDAPPGGTLSGSLQGGAGNSTRVSLVDAAGTPLYQAPIKNDGTFVLGNIAPGFYKSVVSGQVAGPVLDQGVLVAPGSIGTIIFKSNNDLCLVSPGNSGLRASPSRKAYISLRGSSIHPEVTPSSPYGIYFSKVHLDVTFTATPQEPNGPTQRVEYSLIDTTGKAIATFTDTAAPWSATFNVGDLHPYAGKLRPHIRAKAYSSDPNKCPTTLQHDLEVMANPFDNLGVVGPQADPITWDNNAQLYRINAIFPHIADILPVDFKFPPPGAPAIPGYGRLDNYLNAGVRLVGTISLGGDVYLLALNKDLYAKLMDNEVVNDQEELLHLDQRLKLDPKNPGDLSKIAIPFGPFTLADKNFTILAVKAPVITLFGLVSVNVDAHFNVHVLVDLSGQVAPLQPAATVTLIPTLNAPLSVGASVDLLGVVGGGVEGRATLIGSAPLNVKLLPDPSADLRACLNFNFVADGYVMVDFGLFSKHVPVVSEELYSYNKCVNVIGDVATSVDAASIQASDPPDIPDDFAAPAIAIAADGTQLSAYVANTAAAGETERSQVLARFKAPNSQAWSDPVALTNPARIASSPAVAFAGPDSTPIVAWVENTLTAEEAAALGDTYDAAVLNTLLNHQEIAYSTWNGQSWNTPVFMTTDQIADGLPVLAGSSAGAVLAWTRDTDGDLRTRADQRIAASLYDLSKGAFADLQLLTSGDGFNASVAAAYDQSVTPAHPYLAWIHDSDADLNTPDDRTVVVASYDGSNWGFLPNTGLPVGIDSPAISAGADGIHLAFLKRTVAGDGSVAVVGINGALWTALFSNNTWSAQPLAANSGEPVYAESPRLQSLGDETLLAFRRFGQDGNAGDLGQIALSQIMAGNNPTAPLYVTDQPTQNWQPALAISALDKKAVILKVARTTSVGAASQATAASLDSIASTEEVMASQTATLNASGDAVEEVGLVATADLALDSLTLTTTSPAPNDVVTVTVTVRNVGRNAAGDAAVALYSGEVGKGTLIESQPVPAGMGFDESFVAKMKLTASGGEQTIYAELTTSAENQSTANDRATTTLGHISTPTLTGVTESADFTDGLVLSWVSSSDEYVSGYRILRSTAEEGPFELAGEANVTTFTDTQLKPGQSYCYTVQAYNANTLSDQSPVMCSTLAKSQTALFIPMVQR